MLALLFILFAGLAVGCAISMVAQRNPLYGAISLIGVFISLACLYVTLAAPFIAAVQVIIYAGAIMVLVVFVIMLLNVEEEERRPMRMRSLIPIAVGLAAILFAEAAFIIFFVQASPATPTRNISDVGLTSSIGAGLFTSYLLPFEITSILLLMAIVGAMTLARRGGLLPEGAGDRGSSRTVKEDAGRSL
jgi:NADH-quinone oxidoreductase subunit J